MIELQILSPVYNTYSTNVNYLLCLQYKFNDAWVQSLIKEGKRYNMTLRKWKTLMSSFEYKWIKEVFWADQRDLGRTFKATSM